MFEIARSVNFRADVTLEYRQDIQSLRALAILLVVASHFPSSPITGGFVGVDIFFVISGYLVSGLILVEYRESGDFDYWRFFSARIRRLFPALFCTVLIYTAVAYFALGSNFLIKQYHSMIASLLWTANVFFLVRDVDYFGSALADYMMLHSWSLAVEEQFYLIWPFMLVLFLSRFRGWRVSWLISFISGLAVLSFVSAIAVSWSNPMVSFFATPFRMWEFCLGALAFLARHQNSNVDRPADQNDARVMYRLGIGLIILGVIVASWYPVKSVMLLVLPCLGAYLVLSCRSSVPNDLKLTSTTQYIAKISYTWYLSHWPILVIFAALGLTSVAHNLLALTIGFISAILVAELVEAPIRRLQISKPRQVTALGIVCAFSLSLMAWSHLKYLTQEIQTDSYLPLMSARADVPVIYNHGCDEWFHSSDLKPCRYTPNNARGRVVLLADSTGAQWFSAIHQIFVSERSWELVVLTKSACSIPRVEYFYPRLNRIYSECDEWRDSAIQLIREEEPNIVIIGSSNYAKSKKQQVDGASYLLSEISGATSGIAFVGSHPSLNFDPIDCLAAHVPLSEDVACEYRYDRLAFGEKNEVIREIGATRDKTWYLDTTEIVCPEGVCSAYDGDVIVFRDRGHLTNSFVLARTAALRAYFAQVLALGI